MSTSSEEDHLNGNPNKGKYQSIRRRKSSLHTSQVHLTWENLTVSWTSPSSLAEADTCSEAMCGADAIPNIILDDLSGVAKPGDFIAIMGASGSGKTTLLKTLASRISKTLDVSGVFKINGHEIPESKLKDISGYVGQFDTYMASMTVIEVLNFNAALLLDQEIPRKEKELMTEEVLQKVGLTKVKDVVVGDVDNPGISGGEKRRLAVATQLILGASLLFLDEVTSGLDSFMAESIIRLIKDLTASGCTILCTIHQPASVLYDMFDKVCLMSEGKTAFLGSPEDALAHFEAVGYPCPPLHCPTDHFIYTLAIKPESEIICRERSEAIVQAYKSSEFFDKVVSDIESISESFENIDEFLTKSKTRASFWTQVSENVKRGLREVQRNPRYSQTRFVSALVLGCFFSIFYFDTTNDIETAATDRSGLFFLYVVATSLRTLSFSSYNVAFSMPLVIKEYQNGMYTSLPYFISVVIGEFLLLVPCMLLELLIFYFVVGLKREADAFFNVYGGMLLMTYASLAIGWFIGVVAESPPVASAISAGICMPFVFLIGVVKDDQEVLPFLIPIKYLSWMRYAYRFLMVNELKDLPLRCGDEVCPINGTTILIEQGFNPDELWWPNIFINFSFGVVFLIMTSLLLAYKIARK